MLISVALMPFVLSSLKSRLEVILPTRYFVCILRRAMFIVVTPSDEKSVALETAFLTRICLLIGFCVMRCHGLFIGSFVFHVFFSVLAFNQPFFMRMAVLCSYPHI